MPLFRVDNFTGGVTDRYLQGDPSTAQKMENLVLDENGELNQRPGVGQFDDIVKQIPPGAQRIDSIWYFDETVFVKSSTKLYYWDTSDVSQTDWLELAGPSSNAAFAGTAVGQMFSASNWNGHVFFTPASNSSYSGNYTVKVYRNSSGNWTLIAAGLPDAADATTGGVVISPTSSLGTGDSGRVFYRWYVVFSHEYTAQVDGNSITFLDVGNPVLDLSGTYDSFETTSNSYQAGTYNYSNSSTEHYPTSTMKVWTYRTVGNGFIPKYAVQDNMGATIVDNVDDSDLGADLYVGDLRNPISGNYPAPRARYSTLVDNRMVYAACEDTSSGDFFFDRVMESKPGDLDSVPPTNFVDIGEEIVGLSHINVYPVVFTKDRVFRIEGHFDLYGNGYMRARIISETEGLVNDMSVIRLEDQILFASSNGFCWTDGFKVRNITDAHLRETYKAILFKRDIAGTFNRKNKRALWTVCVPGGSPISTPNTIFCLDMRRPLNPEGGGVFTTWVWENGNYQPNCIFYEEDNQEVLVGGYEGFVTAFKDDQKYDLVINTSQDVDEFSTMPIVPEYISAAVQGASKSLSIWMTKVFCIFENITTNLSLTCGGYDDDTGTSYSLLPVRQRSVTGIHKFKRWWNRSNLRGIYKQFWVKKGLINIVWSDDYTTASTSGTTVTLDSGSWPNYESMDLSGYYIYFNGGATGYLITAQSGGTLTVSASPGTLSNATWEVKGAPKTEGFHLKSVTMEFQQLGESYGGYGRDTDVGGNS